VRYLLDTAYWICERARATSYDIPPGRPLLSRLPSLYAACASNIASWAQGARLQPLACTIHQLPLDRVRKPNIQVSVAWVAPTGAAAARRLSSTAPVTP
jgi:hypothetical protein